MDGLLAANDVPLWAALVIGLGGASLAVLVRIAYDRGVEFRTRQLTAAEDFLRTATVHSQVCEDLWKLQRDRQPGTDDELRERYDALRSTEDEVWLATTRLDLLFGAFSPTRYGAAHIITGQQEMMKGLEELVGAKDHVEGSEDPDTTYRSGHQYASDAFRSFAAAARNDLRRTAVMRHLFFRKKDSLY